MEHTITIDKLVHGGRGIARLENNMIVLVPFVLPGEQVIAREAKKHRSYLEAEPVTILQSSPQRTIPPCSFFTRCGGCDFQHMTIGAQLKAKGNILHEAFLRAGISLQEDSIAPAISSPLSYNYRYRVRLKISPDGRIGFHESGSNSVVDITSCPIATPEINEALREIRAGLPIAFLTLFRELELVQNPSDNAIHSILHPDRNASVSGTELAGSVASCRAVSSFSIKKGRKVTPAGTKRPALLSQDFDERMCGRSYSLAWHPGSFSQVNILQNEALVSLVSRLAGNCNGLKILDLFCGSGNFSIPLALKGAHVTGVEHDALATARAAENARINRIKKIDFSAHDVRQWLQKKIHGATGYDTIVLDPPRKGMGKDTRLLAELGAKRIIYISCDPATLARDASLLVAAGYNLISATPVDMFPQTHHIESVVLLEKN